MANPRTDAIIIDGLVLRPVESLSRAFGMKNPGVCKMLRALKVPIGYFGDKGYVCTAVLAEALLSCMDLGAGGFMAPGSVAKKRSADKLRPNLAADCLPDKDLHSRHRTVVQRRLDRLRADSRTKDRDFVRTVAAAVQKPPAKAPFSIMGHVQ